MRHWSKQIGFEIFILFHIYQIEIWIGKIISPKTNNNMNISHVEISGYIYIDF